MGCRVAQPDVRRGGGAGKTDETARSSLKQGQQKYGRTVLVNLESVKEGHAQCADVAASRRVDAGRQGWLK
jgi:hypothetical protein